MLHDARIRKLEVGVKNYVDDDIKEATCVVHTYFDRFKIQVLVKVIEV